MNDILYILCRHNVCIMDGWLPYPARLVAENCGISLSKARRELRKLKDNGYVVSISEVIDPEESTLPYHGWNIAKKAYSTEEYKKAAELEADICEMCFSIPKEQMLKALLKDPDSEDEDIFCIN